MKKCNWGNHQKGSKKIWSCSRDLGFKSKRQNNLYQDLFKYLTGLPMIDVKINANISSVVIFSY